MGYPSYRHFRFEFPTDPTGSGVIILAEIELLSAGVDATNGKTATANAFFGAGYEASKAIDDSAATRWQVNAAYPHWWQVDLGTVTQIESYSLQAGSANGIHAPRDWILKGSNDGTNWTTLDSKSGQSAFADSEKRSFATAVFTISGTIIDSNGSPVARTVRAYRRDTGELVGSAVSNSVTGTYAITTLFSGEVQVVMLDDTLGTLENDQILRTTPV